MKRTILILVLVLFMTVLYAEGWNTSADVSLNLNQNSYSDNWAGDEIGAISWAFNANLLAEKQLTQKINNKNTLKFAFGQTHSQYVAVDSTKKWAKPDKTTDLIDFESMFRFTLGLVVDPFTSVRWESQFLDESSDETKSFNPNTLTETFGVARVFIKDEKRELSSRLGAAFKLYIDGNADKNSNDGGIEFVAEYRSPLANDLINYNTKLNLYKALFYSLSEDMEGTVYEDDWKAVRLSWEHIFTAIITKLINLNLYVGLIYNEMDLDLNAERIDEIQFKQTLGLGLIYKLF
ncbi:MAG: DUF3078 domain-containing protein [Candidatus Cloacimonetes bacterium]|nr:DUF3078 domain-containing protein [Candidatus Cloacimonadota bacterium]MBL7149221.1 DUF3078 domain-containing protein [Candidatus Cloacimonadota bacterium]